MTLSLTDGRVEVYQTQSSSDIPDLTIEAPDLRSVEVSLEVQEDSGKAKIKIDNYQGKYAGKITPGDKLEFIATIGGGTAAPTAYSDGSYGNSTYGVSSGSQRRWMGLAGIPRYKFEGAGNRTMSISAYPYAFGVMGTLGRKVDNAFRQTPVGEIARTILEDGAPELDPSGIEPFSNTVIDIEFSGTPLQKAMIRLAKQADAVLTARGDTVVMKPTSGIPVQWTATSYDFNTWDTDGVDDELWNQIRVEGGTANDVGDSQKVGDVKTVDDITSVPGYTNASEDSIVTAQLTLPKSRIDEVKIWTKPTNTEESLTVGIQEDIGGAPTKPKDKTKDLVNKSLPHDEMTDDGITSYLLKYTELPARNPWLIIRSDGKKGHKVGLNTTSDPGKNASEELIYAAYYPYQTITQKRDAESIERYLRREHRIERDNITTAQAAADTANATLRHHADLEWTFDSDAASVRAHRLRPAEAIELEFPEERAVGTYLVTGRTDRYAPSDDSKNLLKTDLKLQEIESF